MSTKITMQQLREAHQRGQWTLERASAFRLYHYTDFLAGPSVVIKKGTVVAVEKVYRRGRAALLRYTERSGKVWWSWTHASEHEPPRKYTRKVIE